MLSDIPIYSFFKTHGRFMQQNRSKEKACISTKVHSEPIMKATANFRHKVAFLLKALQGPQESSGA